MKVIVFSDSHRDIDTMEKVAVLEKPDMVLHLGDHAADGVELDLRLPDIPVVIVSGNCDLWTAVADEKFIDLDGIKILMTHGHNYGVRAGYSNLISEGRKRGADLILCGHTHIPKLIKKKDIILMNPGKAGKFSRGPHKPTYGKIDTNAEPMCSIIKISSII